MLGCRMRREAWSYKHERKRVSLAAVQRLTHQSFYWPLACASCLYNPLPTRLRRVLVYDQRKRFTDRVLG